MDVWGLERESRDGRALTRRMWAMTDALADVLGEPLQVAQGSWNTSVAASGSTHAESGAADWRIGNLTSAQVQQLVHTLRSWGVCAWLRDAEHGGFAPHVHGIDRYDPGLSSGARWQVQQYDRGRDGLTKAGPDYHPRPPQHMFTLEDAMALTDDDVERIAQAVWSLKREQFPDRSTYGLLVDVRRATVKPVTTDGGAGAAVNLDALADTIVDRLADRLAK